MVEPANIANALNALKGADGLTVAFSPIELKTLIALCDPAQPRPIPATGRKCGVCGRLEHDGACSTVSDVAKS